MLDLIVGAIAVGVVGFAVRSSSPMSGADVGIGLNLILVANTTLIRLIESWTSLEISLGAIARIMDIDLHAPREELAVRDKVLDIPWPSKGELSMQNVSVYYG